MSSALALEKMMTIAYPVRGGARSSGRRAKIRFQPEIRGAKDHRRVFAAVSRNRANYGVVPVENSAEGAVAQTLDGFVDSDLKIVSQIILHEQQCLMILPGGLMAKIRKLYVHPQSLARCRGWIQNHLPRVKIIETPSAARAAELARKDKNSRPSPASLPAVNGPAGAGKDIQDDAANVTRFLILGRQCSPPTGDDRTSLMVSVTDKAGAKHIRWRCFAVAKST